MPAVDLQETVVVKTDVSFDTVVGLRGLEVVFGEVVVSAVSLTVW